MNIGLALSGGGYRATVFHLGVLARLSEDNLLGQIRFVSTVSGGSITIGLIFASNNNQWPDSATFQSKIVPFSFRKLTTENLQSALIWDNIIFPLNILFSRAKLVSRKLERQLEFTGNLQELPDNPRWIINTSCFESGRNWRFEKKRMGGYFPGIPANGNLDSPSYRISDAVAASCAFPIAIGPMTLDTKDYENWYEYDDDRVSKKELVSLPYTRLHLYDGGVYDNIGLEPLINFDKYEPRPGIDYLMVSNASGKLDRQRYKPGLGAIARLVSMMKFQVEGLRSRDSIHRFKDHKLPGRYFDTDNTCESILTKAGYSNEKIVNLCSKYLEKSDVDKLSRESTHIRRLEKTDFKLLFRLGFEVADCTLHGFEKTVYNLIGFDSKKWEKVYKYA